MPVPWGGRWVRTTPLFVQSALFDLTKKVFGCVSGCFGGLKWQNFLRSPSMVGDIFSTALFLQKQHPFKSFTVRP